MVLLVSILFGITAISAADTNDTAMTNDNTHQVVDTQTESFTNIESNSIKNTVSNEYETITNENSSTEKTITKKSTETTSNSKQATNKEKVNIQTTPITAKSNQLIKIQANVTDKNGDKLSSAKSAIKINGKTIGSPRVTDGIVSLSYEIPMWHAKEYNITIIVGETSHTATTSINTSLFIQRHDLKVEFGDYNVSSADKTQLKAKVNFEDGTKVNGSKAVFKINGKTIGSTIVKDGIASINFIVPNKAKNYTLTLKIGPTTVSNYFETTSKMVVNKRNPTIISDVLYFVKNGYSLTLKASLTDIGYANASGKIGFKVNGKTVATNEIENNTVSCRFDASKLSKGNHVVTIVYGGSNALNEVRKNVTLRVQSDLVSTYTYDQILEKANLTYIWILNNAMLPNYALMSGNPVSRPDFLYMLTQILTYNNSFHNGGFSAPSSNGYTTSYGTQVNLTEYLALAQTIVDSYISNGKAPSSLKTSSGYSISFDDAFYSYTKIVSYLRDHGQLPNYVTVTKISPSTDYTNPSSGSSSSGTSSYTPTNTVPSGYSEYLGSAKNADVNTTTIKNAVAAAVKGVSGSYNQAVAIFNYVNAKTDYSSYFNTRYGAIGTLTRGYGNCVDMSHLLLGMYRTANLPARYCHATCYFRSGLIVGHVWVEVYVNGKWYSCDTTSNRNSFGNIVNWYKSSSIRRYTSLSF